MKISFLSTAFEGDLTGGSCPSRACLARCRILNPTWSWSPIANLLGYALSPSPFRPEELKVDLEGNQLVVTGEHSESREGESIERRFQRRVVLPQGIAHDPDSIKCSVDANGVLEIEARRPKIEGQETHNIPIEVGCVSFNVSCHGS